MRAVKTLCAAGICLAATQAGADQLWQSNSLTLVNGDHYKFGTSEQTLLTYTHVSGYSWGDLFGFVDYVDQTNGDSNWYGEVAPRVSLGKTLNRDFSFGPIKDVLLAGQMEFNRDNQNSKSNFNNYLYGVGLDWNVPGFSYLQTNVYKVDNELEADDEQLTITWGVPFKVERANLEYSGFIDWSSANGKGTSGAHAASMNFTSYVKMDAGALMGYPNRFFAGVKYIYINDKYGVKDADERNLNLLAEVRF